LENGHISHLSHCSNTHPRCSLAHNNQHGCSCDHHAADHSNILCCQLQKCKAINIQPGTYIADPVPNLEDVDNKSKSKVENAKNVTKFNSETKSRKKKDDFSTNSHEDQSRCQNEPE